MPRRRSLVAADVVAGLALIAAIAVTGSRLSHDSPAPTVRTLTAKSTAVPQNALVDKGLPPADDCKRRGITMRSGDGTCTLSDGSVMTATGPAGTIKLDGLEVRYLGVEVLDRIGSGPAPLRPTGVWVRVRLRITNTLDGSAGFSDTQVALALGRKAVLGPNSYAAASDPQGLETRAADLAAGRTAEGTVSFDVPKKLASRYLRTFAGLRVVTFGENTGAHSRTGLIRIGS
jgi:hypothetical protein